MAMVAVVKETEFPQFYLFLATTFLYLPVPSSERDNILFKSMGAVVTAFILSIFGDYLHHE
jgi:hypothetical protein